MQKVITKWFRSIIMMKPKQSRDLHHAATLNHALLGSQPKVYPLANDRFCFPWRSSHCFIYLFLLFHFSCLCACWLDISIGSMPKKCPENTERMA